MWSRICTTWPEKPHCGNCGVPFMKRTTSFDFTSLSMNCSMLIFVSLFRQAPCGLAFPGRSLTHPCNPILPLYVAQTVGRPKQNGEELICAIGSADGPAAGHGHRLTAPIS